MKTRFSPTPNGLLHLGNLFNLLWVQIHSAKKNLSRGLRIDDYDRNRSRVEYVDHIFKVLDLIGYEWTEGPSNTSDFYKNHSSRLRMDLYRDAFNLLSKSENTYWCECTRKDQPSPIYDGRCRDLNKTNDKKTQLRFNTHQSPSYLGQDLEKQIGDIILWTRGGLPAYQLASVVDDDHYAYDYIVRGDDLKPSSAMQIAIAAELNSKFRSADFVHHRLLMDCDDTKVSKSKSADSVLDLLESRDGVQKALSYFVVEYSKCFDPVLDIKRFAKVSKLSELITELEGNDVQL